MAQWDLLSLFKFALDSDEPKYIQLFQNIEGLILSNQLPPHTKLPSENELDELLDLSRSTIRKGLDELDKRGLVYRKQGQGTFVKPYNLPVSQAESKVAKSGLIGLILPSMMNEIYPQIVRGVEDTAAQFGWNVFIGNTYSDRDREYQLLEQMIGRKVDGLIIEPTHATFDQPGTKLYKFLKNLEIPYVLIDNDIAGLNASEVIIDDFEGGYIAGKHLIEQGHKNIVYVYKESVLAAIERKKGFEKAIDEFNISPTNQYLFPYKESDEGTIPGYTITKQILSQTSRPSAIFYFNDETALQGIQAIRELGLQIPRDVSVLGFDNIQSASNASYQLTTIEHPKYLCGKWASDILFDHINNNSPRVRRRITIHPVLVLRKSVGQIKT